MQLREPRRSGLILTREVRVFGRVISDEELAYHSFCPVAWDLKYRKRIEPSNEPGCRPTVPTDLRPKEKPGVARRNSHRLTSSFFLALAIALSIAIGLGWRMRSLEAAAVVSFLLALLTFWLSFRSKIGVAASAYAYSSENLPGKPQPFLGKPLRSRVYHNSGNTYYFSGRPDYTIRVNNGLIPVIVGDRSRPDFCTSAYSEDVIRALAHCALLRKAKKGDPPYALVVYAGKEIVKVEATSEMMKCLRDELHDIKISGRKYEIKLLNGLVSQCAACRFRSKCDQSLAKKN